MQVKLYATLRALAGVTTIDLPLGDGATVRQLAECLAEHCPALADQIFEPSGELSRRVHFMVDGRNSRWLPQGAETPLRKLQTLDIFPPAAGG
ncbi:MAG: MoaD/ThiS family protein [Myxococcota bacterium]|nr:MoaD/ThiS family protein [Myxococcota bacterium]